MRSVLFTDDADDFGDFEVVRVDGGSLADKDELLDAIAEGFGFPDWFGRNWDAVEECLRDLHSAGEGYALLVSDATRAWSDRPRLMGTLVEVWIDAAEHAQERGVELLLAFEW